MAASATCLAGRVAPLQVFPSRTRKACSQEARSIGVVQPPVCAHRRDWISSGSMSLGPSRPGLVLAHGNRDPDCRTAVAVDKVSFGRRLCFAPGPLSREQHLRRSVRVQADEPSEAERQVAAKESLLRDALEEKSKKVEESKPAAGFKVENRQQVTAIVTGIISIALAFGYLSLISLDSRGVNLIPPPPEALGE